MSGVTGFLQELEYLFLRKNSCHFRAIAIQPENFFRLFEPILGLPILKFLIGSFIKCFEFFFSGMFIESRNQFQTDSFFFITN